MPLTLQALRDEIAKNKALLDTLEDTGKEIIADSSEDPQVVRDVRGELNKIVSPVDAILRKLAERQVKLQNALLRSQEFQVQTDAHAENLCSILILHAFLYQKFASYHACYNLVIPNQWGSPCSFCVVST